MSLSPIRFGAIAQVVTNGASSYAAGEFAKKLRAYIPGEQHANKMEDVVSKETQYSRYFIPFTVPGVHPNVASYVVITPDDASLETGLRTMIDKYTNDDWVKKHGEPETYLPIAQATLDTFLKQKATPSGKKSVPILGATNPQQPQRFVELLQAGHRPSPRRAKKAKPDPKPKIEIPVYDRHHMTPGVRKLVPLMVQLMETGPGHVDTAEFTYSQNGFALTGRDWFPAGTFALMLEARPTASSPKTRLELHLTQSGRTVNKVLASYDYHAASDTWRSQGTEITDPEVLAAANAFIQNRMLELQRNYLEPRYFEDHLSGKPPMSEIPTAHLLTDRAWSWIRDNLREIETMALQDTNR